MQNDCCIFFKLIDEVEVEGGVQKTLNNIFICSQDSTRCMYKALLIGKEIEVGCNEVVNSEIADGIMNNPNFRQDSPLPGPQGNSSPPGYTWVDEEGWVDIEKHEESLRASRQNDFNFCSDAYRFRKGG